LLRIRRWHDALEQPLLGRGQGSQHLRPPQALERSFQHRVRTLDV